jgi:hypothetical protein
MKSIQLKKKERYGQTDRHEIRRQRIQSNNIQLLT